MKPFISTAFYGVLNYVIALTLIGSPWFFGLRDVSSAAFLLPLYIGWLQLIMAIFVDNETGFVKKFPMQIHLALDVAMGFILAVSPWLYTFSAKNSGTAFWPALIIGGLLLFLGLFTRKSPFTTRRHQAVPEGLLTSLDSYEGRLNV